MVYSENLSESQRVMLWRLIIKYFGSNIRYIDLFDNILDDEISRLMYTSVNKYKHITMKAQCCTNELFTISRVEENNKYSPH